MAPQKLLTGRRRKGAVLPGCDVICTWYSYEHVRDLMETLHGNPYVFAAWNAIANNMGRLQVVFKHGGKGDPDIFPPTLLDAMTRVWSGQHNEMLSYLLTLGFVPYTVESPGAGTRSREGSDQGLHLRVPEISLLTYDMYQYGVMTVISTGMRVMVCRAWDRMAASAGAGAGGKGPRSETVSVGMDDGILTQARFYVKSMPGETLVSPVVSLRRVIIMDQAADRHHTTATECLADPVIPMIPQLNASEFMGLNSESTRRMAQARAESISKTMASSVLAAEATCRGGTGTRDVGVLASRMQGDNPLIDAMPGGVAAVYTQPAPLAVTQRIAMLPAFAVPVATPQPQIDPGFNETRLAHIRAICMAMGVPMSFLSPDLSRAQMDDITKRTMKQTTNMYQFHLSELMMKVWDETNGMAIRKQWTQLHKGVDSCMAMVAFLRRLQRGGGLTGFSRPAGHISSRWRMPEVIKEKPIGPGADHRFVKAMKAKHRGAGRAAREMDAARRERDAALDAGLPHFKAVLGPSGGGGSGARSGVSTKGRMADSDSEFTSGSDSSDSESDGSDSDSDQDLWWVYEDEQEGHTASAPKKKRDKDGADDEGTPRSIDSESVQKFMGLTPEKIKTMASHLTKAAWRQVEDLIALESTRVSVMYTDDEDVKLQLELFEKGMVQWEPIIPGIAALARVDVSFVTKKDPIMAQEERDITIQKMRMKEGLVADLRLTPGTGKGPPGPSGASKPKPKPKPAAGAGSGSAPAQKKRPREDSGAGGSSDKAHKTG